MIIQVKVQFINSIASAMAYKATNFQLIGMLRKYFLTLEIIRPLLGGQSLPFTNYKS